MSQSYIFKSTLNKRRAELCYYFLLSGLTDLKRTRAKLNSTGWFSTRVFFSGSLTCICAVLHSNSSYLHKVFCNLSLWLTLISRGHCDWQSFQVFIVIDTHFKWSLWLTPCKWSFLAYNRDCKTFLKVTHGSVRL